MSNRRKKMDKHVQMIRNHLKKEYGVKHPKARIQVYRYNPACILVRVMDPDFSRVEYTKRQDLLWSLVEQLPEETWTQLSMLLPITPKEHKDSWLTGSSRRFDEGNGTGK